MALHRAVAAALIAASFFVTVGCTSSADGTTDAPASETPSAEQDAPEEAPEPVSLVGEWTQTNANSDENYQAATITADAIEVYWIADGGDTRSLYWAGTAEVHADAGDSFSWDSVNDTSKTDGALLASGDDSKTFTYEDGELSFEVTAMGTTTTVRLARD